MKLTIRKYDPSDPSRFSVDEARALYMSTTYDLRVYAADFAADRTSACAVQLLRRRGEDDASLTVYAAGTLAADPYRRNCRCGTLVVGDSGHSDLFRELAGTGAANVLDDFVLSVTLGAASDKVIYAPCAVVVSPYAEDGSSGGGESGGGSSGRIGSSSDLWTRVDLGGLTVDSNTLTDADGLAFAVPLRDRTMSKCTIDISRYTGTKNFHIVPLHADGSMYTDLTDFYEAVLVVQLDDVKGAENLGSWSSSGLADIPGSRLGKILRGGALPPVSGVNPGDAFLWDYDDSRTMPSPSGLFIVRVVRYPYEHRWHAEFRVSGAAPIGVEVDDQEGVAVPGANVNATGVSS